MRLLDLTFDVYGPFAGLQLTFDPQARLHIVYGPNEAGKSSALKALGDLFYGAPRRAEVGFLRPRELRLGATVSARNGQTLQFFRRRGDKNTLLNPAGAPLPDDALLPFLGGVSRDTFDRAFGLDAEGLRSGGDDMLRAEGEIGASLLAAASGLRGLVDLRKKLDAEADTIFADRKAGHRAFYQSLDSYAAANDRAQKAMLHESRLKGLRGEIAAAGEKRAALAEARIAALSERQRWARLLKAAPLLRRLSTLRAEFSALDDLAALPPDWASRLATTMQAQAAAEEAFARAAQALDLARGDLADMTVDQAILAEAEKIEALVRASGAYDKAAADLPRREEALREARRLLLSRARDCGFADADSLAAAAPDAAALNRADKLCLRGRELTALAQAARQSLAEEEAVFARLRDDQGEPAPDPQPMREKLSALGGAAHIEAQWRELALDAAQSAQALAERCARLSPPLADLAAFARAPSPDAAAIERAARRFDELDARETAARQRAHDAESALAAAEKSLAELNGFGAVASLGALREARERRDAEWRFLRAALLGEKPAPAPERYEALNEAADRAADALLADSARAAAAEAAREKIAASRREAAEAERSLAELASDRAAREAEWAAAWAASGVAPLPPRQMAGWRGEAERLIEARENLARRQAKASELERDVAAARPALAALAVECGLAPLEHLDCAASLRRIETRLAEFAKAFDAARDAQARLAEAPRRIARQKERLGELAAETNLWRDEWRVALALLRLDNDAGFDEAQQRIALWRALPGELEDAREKSLRAEKIVADLSEFEQRLDALLAVCAPALPSRPAARAVAGLRDRLSQARETLALRKKAEAHCAQTEAAAEAAAADRQAAERTTLGILAEAEASGLGGDPQALRARLEQRQTLGAALAEARGRLDLIADGIDEARLAEQAAGFDADAAQLRLAELDRLLAANEEQDRENFAALRARESELEALQDSLGAEAAIQERESARAGLLDDARRWAVLRLASLLVEAGLERSRERGKDPLLARAGALFSMLTLGRYSGLDEAFGEDDSLRLRARRADGATLDLDGLSEGARDQLYLALRLAFLEDFAGRSEAPPLVCDDIFASFDESRVAAGLRALADAGGLLQPIVFTHHAHVVEIAGSALAADAQILRLE